MTEAEIRNVYEAISQGEISRPEAARRLGTELSFGDMLLGLRGHDLPLPRFASDPTTPGYRLVLALASREDRVGG